MEGKQTMTQSKWNDNKFRQQKAMELQRIAANSNTPSFISPEVKLFKAKAGKSIIRIMDATWPSATHYGYPVILHWGLGPNKATVLCLRMKNQMCPACEDVEKARRNNDQEYVDDYVGKTRIYIFVIDRENENAGPLLFGIPRTLNTDLAAAAEDETTKEILFIDDPNEGYDVVLTRVNPGGNVKRTKYSPKLARQSSKLSNDPETAKTWLKFVADHPIPSLFKFETAERISELMAGNIASPEEEELTSEIKPTNLLPEEDESNVNNSSNDVELTEESVTKMKRKELMELILDRKLSIDPDDFDSTQDLAEAVAMELQL